MTEENGAYLKKFTLTIFFAGLGYKNARHSFGGLKSCALNDTDFDAFKPCMANIHWTLKKISPFKISWWK